MKSSIRPFLLVFIILSALGCSSCATYNAATGKREFQIIDNNSETRIGANINAEFAKKYKVSANSSYDNRVLSVGKRILSSIKSRGIGYKFLVVEDPNMNAFTVPGGYIYATTALMENVGSDDELAAVLAHEIGHSEARHAVKNLESAIGYTTLMTLAYVLDPREEDKKGDWVYIKSGTDAMFQIVNLGYSRKDEYEADRLSIRYMREAGYDQYAILSLLTKLKEKEKGKDIKWLYFIRSHPYIDERMAAARVEIDKEGVVIPSPSGNEVSL